VILTVSSGVTRVFGARGQKQWSAPPLERPHVSLTPTVRFWSDIGLPLWLCQAANYHAILWFPFNSMLNRKAVVGINRRHVRCHAIVSAYNCRKMYDVERRRWRREYLRAQAEAFMSASSITLQYYSLLRSFLLKLATTSGSLQLCPEIIDNILSWLCQNLGHVISFWTC